MLFWFLQIWGAVLTVLSLQWFVQACKFILSFTSIYITGAINQKEVGQKKGFYVPYHSSLPFKFWKERWLKNTECMNSFHFKTTCFCEADNCSAYPGVALGLLFWKEAIRCASFISLINGLHWTEWITIYLQSVPIREGTIGCTRTLREIHYEFQLTSIRPHMHANYL